MTTKQKCAMFIFKGKTRVCCIFSLFDLVVGVRCNDAGQSSKNTSPIFFREDV